MAIGVLLAMSCPPYGGVKYRPAGYAFIFEPTDAPLDVPRLLLNVGFAALAGAILANLSRRTLWVLGSTVALLAIALGLLLARVAAIDRAESDERYAEVLLENPANYTASQEKIETAKHYLRNAADNWRIALRPADRKRVLERERLIGEPKAAKKKADWGANDPVVGFLPDKAQTSQHSGDDPFTDIAKADRGKPITADELLNSVDASPSPRFVPPPPVPDFDPAAYLRDTATPTPDPWDQFPEVPAVEVENFLFDEVGGSFSFSLHNSSGLNLSHLQARLLFYNPAGQLIESYEFRHDDVIGTGLTKRLTGQVTMSVRELNSPIRDGFYPRKPAGKVEFQLLRFKLYDGAPPGHE